MGRDQPTQKRAKKRFRFSSNKKPKTFDSFKAQSTHTDSTGKIIKKGTTTTPETGIHSQTWALSITPQPLSPLLSLPLELRLRIWTYTLHLSAQTPDSPLPQTIAPSKQGQKFLITSNGSTCISQTQILSSLCRQSYLDITGSSLLYQTLNFEFSSPHTMATYLAHINPRHKDSIKRIILHNITITSQQRNPPKSTILLLASLPYLQNLALYFEIDSGIRSREVSKVMRGMGVSNSVHAFDITTLDRIRDYPFWTEIKGLRDVDIHVCWGPFLTCRWPPPGGVGWDGFADEMRKLLVVE